MRPLRSVGASLREAPGFAGFADGFFARLPCGMVATRQWASERDKRINSRNASRAGRLRRLGPARLREPPRSLSRQAMAIRVGRTRRSRVVLFALVLLALLLVRRHWRSSPDVSSARTDLADRRDVALGIGEDGRLAVREGEPHPIPALMARARRQWADLRARQSKTFAQAVAEYERRYGRKPPKGFDQWYDEHPLALLTLQVCVCTAAQCPAHRRVRPDRA